MIIKLTQMNGQPIYVNVNHIRCFYEGVDPDGTRYTRLEFTTASWWRIKESSEEISNIWWQSL